MSDGCSSCSAELEANSGSQAAALIVALAVNAVMFAVELGAGLWGHSSALQADSIDMLIDAISLGAGLLALNRTASARARAGFLNAFLELVLAIGIVAQLTHQIVSGAQPVGVIMLVVGGAALTANLGIAFLLMRFRSQDVNMRALWLCTRNDAIGNAATLAAGAIVLCTGIPWPDWVVGALIAILFIRTSVGLMRETWPEMRRPAAPTGD